MTTDWDNPRPPSIFPPAYPTFAWFKFHFGADVFEGPRLHSYDVVGGDQEGIERWRSCGTRLRYFKTHRERLDEFGARLARFERVFLLRSDSRFNGFGLLLPLGSTHHAAMPSKPRHGSPNQRLAARFRRAWLAFFT